MDRNEQQPARPEGNNPVVRVPVESDPLSYRRRFIEAPADAASHWDERIWRRM